MKSGIYIIKNISNNKFYIGSSKNLSKRKSQHFSLLNKNQSHCKLLQRAYNKYGSDNFKFEIIAKCPEEYLFKLEQWFVDSLKPNYNICIKNVAVPIGLVRYIYTNEHKEIKRKEAFDKLNNNKNFGWKSRVIIQLDDNEKVLKEYSSLKEYASEHNCSIGNVGKSLKTGNKCKGFYVKYK